jgi:hypothetical protein
MRITTILFCISLLAISGGSQAFELIKAEEAKLPAATGDLMTRGITRGPAIKVVSPDLSSGPLKSPLNLKLAFEPRGGAKIDAASLKVNYLKATPIDLLPRIKSGVTESGIDLANAEIPPGEHAIQITLQDSEGRKTSTVIKLTIAK